MIIFIGDMDLDIINECRRDALNELGWESSPEQGGSAQTFTTILSKQVTKLHKCVLCETQTLIENKLCLSCKFIELSKKHKST